MTSEERSAYNKKWASEHKEQRKEYQRNWHQKKKTELKELQMKAAAYDKMMKENYG